MNQETAVGKAVLKQRGRPQMVYYYPEGDKILLVQEALIFTQLCGPYVVAITDGSVVESAESIVNCEYLGDL